MGVKIPRDSGDQKRWSKPLKSGAELECGDVVFFARKAKPGSIHHIIMFLGDGVFVECTGLGFSSAKDVPDAKIFTTRLSSDNDDFRKEVGELKNGDELTTGIFKGNIVYFGTFLAK